LKKFFAIVFLTKNTVTLLTVLSQFLHRNSFIHCHTVPTLYPIFNINMPTCITLLLDLTNSTHSSNSQ